MASWVSSRSNAGCSSFFGVGPFFVHIRLVLIGFRPVIFGAGGPRRHGLFRQRRVRLAGVRQEEVHILQRVRIIFLHDVGFGPCQQRLVAREERVDGVDITGSCDGIGIFEQIRRMGQQGLVQTAVIYQRPHLPFVGREGRIRAGDALGLADQPSVVVTASRGVSAEIGPRRGVSRRQQVVARQVRTDIVGGCRILGGPVVHRIFQQRLVIAELGFGGVGQRFRGIFRGFVPFLIIQKNRAAKE